MEEILFDVFATPLICYLSFVNSVLIESLSKDLRYQLGIWFILFSKWKNIRNQIV